jgi:basic amino acid/polyamine antiporter, APA family
MSTIAAPASPAVATRGLLRALGAAFGVAIVVGATIGGGILRTPGDVAAQLPNTALFLTVWGFGAFNALLGATAYAELGTMIPRSGGIYTFAHRAMGDGVGFFVGFADWINWSVSSAALILLIGEYLAGFIPAVAGHTTIAGFVIFAGIVGLQWHGVLWGGRFQEITSALKATALIGLVAMAFLLPHAPIAPSASAHMLPSGMSLLVALALSMQAIVFTYDSYYAVVYCGEELRDPGREIPRSIFRGLLLVIGIYLLLNVAFVAVVPIGLMAGDPFVGATVARALFGQSGDAIIRAIMIVSIVGTVNAQMMAAPRILWAMSRDGLFPSQATRVNAGGTPSIAMVLSVLLVAGFLFSGSFTAAINVDSIIILVGYVAVFTSLFVLRRREPAAARPYRAWGYPWVPGLALVFALVILATIAYADPKSAVITLGLLVVSWPAAGLVKRWVKPTP